MHTGKKFVEKLTIVQENFEYWFGRNFKKLFFAKRIKQLNKHFTEKHIYENKKLFDETPVSLKYPIVLGKRKKKVSFEREESLLLVYLCFRSLKSFTQCGLLEWSPTVIVVYFSYWCRRKFEKRQKCLSSKTDKTNKQRFKRKAHLWKQDTF